jgi:hypothetical protein
MPALSPPAFIYQGERPRIVALSWQDFKRRGAREQQVHETADGWRGDAAQRDGFLILDGDLEVVGGHKVEALAQWGGQNKLTFP